MNWYKQQGHNMGTRLLTSTPAFHLQAAYSRFVGVEGYFKSRPHSNSTQQWNLPVPLAAMAECIEHLRRAGWPGVFAYIYDEFWMAAGRLGPIIKAMLGACWDCDGLRHEACLTSPAAANR